MPYTHIFFDLDHTLWDFDKNAEETLHELYHSHGLPALGVSCVTTFIETYTRNNHALWDAYHRGEIDKTYLRETRFKKTFMDLGLAAETVPLNFEDEYLRICPTKTNLFPEVHEILTYLTGKYRLHLISNGFTEATTSKVRVCDLGKYFDNIIISEIVGVNKPSPIIFNHAISLAGCEKNECVMIGDSLEADIKGALDFGMDAIYFNPLMKPQPDFVPRQISQLGELRQWF